MKYSRAIILLSLANSISGIAQGISMLAIPWYFTAVIHRETLFGAVYFGVTFISLFWGMYAGTLVDRYSRKRIFLLSNLVGLFVLTSVSLWGYLHHGLPWYLAALVFANTMLIYNIHFPNLYAFAHEITPKEYYGKVTSLLEIQGQFCFTLAGGIGAIMLKGVDHQINIFGVLITLPFTLRPWQIHEIFTVDAVTYLIAFGIIYSIPTLSAIERHIDTDKLWERVKTGFRFLWHHQALFNFGNTSLLVFLTIIIFGTYVQPAYVDSFLHKGGDAYGFAEMAFSFGALLAGFFTTRVFGEKQAVKGIIVLSAVAGVMYLVFAFKSIGVLFFVANFVIGICNASVRIQRITYLFHHIPNKVIGRAGSIFFVINVFLRLCLISLFALPFFHTGSNIIYAIIIMALICFAGALALAANYRKLMQLPEIS